ncbi:MAG: hypothetical protein JSW43_01205 [Gemmatimonadota bacterium]|nr:MAG: hypothetical protein JSW43_01205 [Gemmatimonadota bacterium]
MRCRATLIRLFALVITVAPTGLRAQARNPSLAGHTFVPTAMVEGPFVATHFRSLVGGARAFGYNVGTVVIDDDTLIALEGNMTWVRVEFEQRQKVADWLALEADFRAGARVGTNAASALSDGVSVITGFKLGGIARVVQSSNVYASATLNVRRTGLTFLNLIAFVEEIIDSVASGGRLDSISLSAKSGAWQGRGGFRLAYAPGRAVGITVLGEVGFGEDFTEVEDAAWDVDLGATVDLNLQSIGKAPLGFVGIYRISTFGGNAESSVGLSHTAGLGISYVGREDFTVGVEVQWMHSPLVNGDALNSVGAAVRSRYYF